MESGGITPLMAPLPGQRIVEGKEPEDGSILAYRKGGDECLFASWESDPTDDPEVERGRGMTWIPVSEFSPDPEAIKPPNIIEEGEEPETVGDEPRGRKVEHGPFGRGGKNLPRRPGAES